MKILFFADNYPPERNAAATRVSERARYWVEWGHEVTVITSVPNFPEGKIHEGYRNRWYQTEFIEGVKVVRVKTFIAANEGFVLRILDFLSYMIVAFVAGLFSGRPDIVTSTSPQFFAAVAAAAVARLRGLPYVFELGDLWPASVTAVGAMKRNVAIRLLERLELALYRLSDRIISLTYSFREDLVARGVDASKVDVIINGVDLRRYSPRERDAEAGRETGIGDEFVVGYIGTHGMAHRLECVVQAAARIEESKGVRFLFVGSGAGRAAAMEEAFRLATVNTIFVTAQPKEKMPRYWSLCDAALVHLRGLPIFTTVIPSKIFEAMGMGIPILFAGPEGEASEIVRRENAGIVVPPENPEALADAVLRLRNDRGLVRELAANSLAAAPRYSREAQARAVLDSYAAAITQRLSPKSLPIERKDS